MDNIFQIKKNDLPWDENFQYSILDICNICGTDWEVGTPPDRMEKGMRELNIPYIEHMGGSKPYELLQRVIEDGNFAILRTITKGVPHWIVATRMHFVYPEKYVILDPALGRIDYNQQDLDSIWAPRQYQFFEILTNGN